MHHLVRDENHVGGGSWEEPVFRAEPTEALITAPTRHAFFSADAAEHSGLAGANDHGAEGEAHGIPFDGEGPQFGRLASVFAGAGVHAWRRWLD